MWPCPAARPLWLAPHRPQAALPTRLPPCPSSLPSAGRLLAEDLNLVLGLDASSGDLSGDAIWASADPSVSVKLTNAGGSAWSGGAGWLPLH